MKIHEVEKLLDIPKATIRFYEKQGLLHPQRKDNAYREYSQEDIGRLKQIIVLRKIGVSVEDIKQILDGDIPLQDVLAKNMEALREQMEELKGAMKVCALMREKEADRDAFDGDYYLNLIRSEESKGQKFFEIARDYLQFEINLLDKITGGGGKSLAGIAISFVIIAVLLGVENVVFFKSNFFNGIEYMLWTFVFLSVALFPTFLLRDKEKAKKIYLNYAGIISLVLLVLVLLFLIVMASDLVFYNFVAK